ncbi:hypothetical protein F4778DRAFT_285694 [Xylariomycetidae sp. FL2044]|nr:hypothetical protein F4778DRAFT_285694 [Xylariomycetidae sp. FL2044]
MDEPCAQWPAWKFGMRRDDLFTKLQDQYNTLAFSIQDPEAFHHDVCEISNTASSTEEFHRLLADRKELRLRELNQSLESASLEIIANPKLIGTEQWHHAIQLFRTKSLDSLVRYFGSYLPEGLEWHANSFDSTACKPFFDDFEEGASVLTDEPRPLTTASYVSIPASRLPPSPRSLTTCSDASSASTPARTLSFSEPEYDLMTLSGGTLIDDYDVGLSQADDPDSDPDSPITSVSDISEQRPLEYQAKDDDRVEESAPELHSDSESVEEADIETPKSRSELPSDTYMQKEVVATSKYTPLERSVRKRSPGVSRVRKGSPEAGRVLKPSPDPLRSRPSGRRRLAWCSPPTVHMSR